MGGRQFGVLIGVNTAGGSAKTGALSYAEADAKALYDLLTDEVIGTFDPADTRLLLGAQATTHAVKTALREAALAATASDVLVVFFAGHGLIPVTPPRDDPYLLTADLDPDGIQHAPDLGLRMSFLRRDVFDIMQGSSFLMLDCCHAGGYAELDLRETSADRSILLDVVETIYERRPTRQSALFACPATGSARESRRLAHGVLTHHILDALSGRAAGRDGSVTFEDLVRHVRAQDIEPKPGFSIQGWGRSTIVTRPSLRPGGPATEVSDPASAVDRMAVEPCANPLDRSVSTLEQLLDRLFRRDQRRQAPTPHQVDRSHSTLERLCGAIEASGAAQMSIVDGRIEVISAVGEVGRRDELTTFARELVEKHFSYADAATGYLGVASNGHPRLLAVRGPRAHGSLIVFADVPPAILDLGEPLAIIVSEIWTEPEGRAVTDTEVAVITALRTRYGRLPSRLYRRCLSIYRDALDSLVMVFEPVLSLSDNPSNLGIYSWEALARRTLDARSAPIGLIDIAATWGDEFTVERDCALAVKAISGYTEAHRSGLFGIDLPKPLSINVSVRSLLNDAYADTLGSAIEDAGLGHYTVTLEISERDPIAPHPDEAEQWKPNPNRYFQNRLRQIAERLQVSFAIDDFGVGHASLDRLASLMVTQVKVDRAILHHPLALDELDLVMRLAARAPSSHDLPSQRIVVVEGFDNQSPVRLSELYAHGIRYVQGYITEEPASQSLRPLGTDLRTRIANMIRSGA